MLKSQICFPGRINASADGLDYNSFLFVLVLYIKYHLLNMVNIKGEINKQ